MIRPILFWLLLTAILSISAVMHPYHVTVTTLNHHNQSGILDIEIKSFVHDLEPALHGFGDTKIDIKNTTDSSFRDSLVHAYVFSNFAITNNGEILKYKPKSITFKDEYAIMNYEVKVTKPKDLLISNSICFEVEKTQTNLVHYKVADIKIRTQKSVNPVNEIYFQL